MSSYFSGIGKVDVRARYAPFLTEGHYRLRVTKAIVEGSKNPKKKKTTFFKVTFDVLEADNGFASKDAAWLVDLGYDEVSLRDIKGFAQALLGPSQPIAEDVLDQMVSEAQPAIGCEVRCHVELAPTTTGGAFSRHFWSMVDDLPAEQAA